MREIKFRVWDKIKKKMEYKPFWSKYLNEFFTKTQFWISLQFTGLKDKNGKEIYEGDIVKKWNQIKKKIFLEEGVFKVQWAKGWGFELRHNKKNHGFCGGGALKDTEVIGNIYENPELLEDTKTR